MKTRLIRFIAFVLCAMMLFTSCAQQSAGGYRDRVNTPNDDNTVNSSVTSSAPNIIYPSSNTTSATQNPSANSSTTSNTSTPSSTAPNSSTPSSSTPSSTPNSSTPNSSVPDSSVPSSSEPVSSDETSSTPSVDRPDKWSDKSDTPLAPSGNVAVRYMIISDIHNDNANVGKAIKTTVDYANTQKYKNLDAILCLGDFSYTGEESEYIGFMNALNKAIQDNGLSKTKISINMGNHEFQNKVLTDAQNKEMVERFKNLTGQPVKEHFVINGYHFIKPEATKHDMSLTDSAKEYLDTELKKAVEDDPDKPVIVVHHMPMDDTVYGASQHFNGNSATYDVIKNYPQVIYHSGHTHNYAANLRTLYEDPEYGFTCQAAGSLHEIRYTGDEGVYGTVEGYTGTSDNGYAMVVEIHDNNVTVIKQFLVNSGEFFSNEGIVGPGHSNTLDARKANSKAPSFPSDAQITHSIGGSYVRATFPAASDDEAVEVYKLEVTKVGESKPTKTVYYTSKYYLGEDGMPTEYSATVNKLKSKTNYKLEIYAIDYFFNESKPLVLEFTT